MLEGRIDQRLNASQKRRNLATLEATCPARARAVPDPLSLSRGSRVGRYEVLRRLGAGTMGVVYEARDCGIGRRVALKLFAPTWLDIRAARLRFQREARALAKLAHPSVVGIHDVGEHDGAVFIAMEYVEGSTLREWLDAKSRSWTEVADVFLRAGAGLEAAHAAGVVHRDFKPENVMIDPKGRVHVMDFGLARFDDDDPTLREVVQPNADTAEASLTQSGEQLGTPAYMAPEQFLGAYADARTDQFNFCVALYEALYGARPFVGRTVAELALSVTDGHLALPPARADVPRWLRRIVLRGLEVEPEDRYQSMTALLAALRRGLTHRAGRSGMLALGSLAVAVAIAGVVTFAKVSADHETDQSAQRHADPADAGDARRHRPRRPG